MKVAERGPIEKIFECCVTLAFDLLAHEPRTFVLEGAAGNVLQRVEVVDYGHEEWKTDLRKGEPEVVTNPDSVGAWEVHELTVDVERPARCAECGKAGKHELRKVRLAGSLVSDDRVDLVQVR